MLQGSSVLMLSGGGMSLALREVPCEAGVHVHIVGSCIEARNALKNLEGPSVLFSDTALPDGTWEEVLALTTQHHQRMPVVVVSRVVDIDLYNTVLEKGASDFIVSPFYRNDISNLLKCGTRQGVAAVQKRAAA